MRDLYQTVTDKIISELEAGTPPWVKPWSDKGGTVVGGMPYNAVSKRQYNGINVPILWACGDAYASRGWLTYKQAAETGGHVRKGERGTLIVYAQPRTIRETVDGEERSRSFPILRSFIVFNTMQCDDLPAEIRGVPVTPTIEPDSVLDWASRTRAEIRHGGDRAFYATSGDYVQMPLKPNFRDADNYAATLLHELTHWSGNESRCNRQFGKRFGDNAYAAEELVAEMGAAFLCARLGIRGQLQHASYLDSWLKVLREDKRAIFTAASKASQAADYIVKLAEPADSTESAPVPLAA